MTDTLHSTGTTGRPPSSARPYTPRARDPVTPPSLIETMRAEPRHALPLLEGHMARLQRSCLALGFRWPGEDAVRRRIDATLSSLDPNQAWRLRLLLKPDGVYELESGVLPSLPAPVNVVLWGPRTPGAESWLQHKTTHRPWYEQAATWLAAHSDVFDVLFWDDDGFMCEGSRSNLYMQTQEGRWLTPPLTAGALPGVQREALLRAGKVEEAPIHRDVFVQAPAIRISNALRGWCDATLVSN